MGKAAQAPPIAAGLARLIDRTGRLEHMRKSMRSQRGEPPKRGMRGLRRPQFGFPQHRQTRQIRGRPDARGIDARQTRRMAGQLLRNRDQPRQALRQRGRTRLGAARLQIVEMFHASHRFLRR